VLRLRFAAFSDEKLVERFRVVAHELGEAVTTCMPAVGLTNRLFAISGALGARVKKHA
jgi:hypothetical protein